MSPRAIWVRAPRPFREVDPAVTDGTQAIVSAFSARVDAVTALWERSIQAIASDPTRNSSIPTRAELSATLERELDELARTCEEYERTAARAEQQALEWEIRAMLSLRDYRYDLYQGALVHRDAHVNEARSAYAIADEFRAEYDACRELIEVIKRDARAD